MTITRDDGLTALANAWIAYSKQAMQQLRVSVGQPPRSMEDLQWAFDQTNEMMRKKPHEGLNLLVRILDSSSDSDVRASIAAGPLEYLLVQHGVTVLDDIARLARQRQDFRQLLQGVWSDGIDDTVWKHIQSLIAEGG